MSNSSSRRTDMKAQNTKCCEVPLERYLEGMYGSKHLR